MHSTRVCSGRPRAAATYPSALEPSSCGRIRIWIQQEPRPRLAAVSCRIVAAIEQSSTQASDAPSSAHTATPRAASARNPAYRGFACDSSASLTVRFADGATGTIFVSAVAGLGDLGQEHRVVLYGENGTLEAYADASTQTVRGLRNGESEFRTLPVPESILLGIDQKASLWKEQFARLFTEQSVGTRLFIDGIVDDRPVSPGFYDGMRVQAVLEAAFEADRSGCRATVR